MTGADLFDSFLGGATETVSSVASEPANIAKLIVGIAATLMVGLLIIHGIDTGILHGNAGNIYLTFSEQPVDGDTFIFDNHIFEYDTNGNYNAGYIPVAIGTTVVDTKNNLLTAITSAGYVATDNSEVIT